MDTDKKRKCGACAKERSMPQRKPLRKDDHIFTEDDGSGRKKKS